MVMKIYIEPVAGRLRFGAITKDIVRVKCQLKGRRGIGVKRKSKVAANIRGTSSSAEDKEASGRCSFSRASIRPVSTYEGHLKRGAPDAHGVCCCPDKLATSSLNDPSCPLSQCPRPW
jgi:hypothetical protein